MDTRLKKYSITRAILFILVITFFTGFVVSTLNLMENSRTSGGLFNIGSYYESEMISSDLSSVVDPISEYILNYRNEEYIKSGASLREGSGQFISKRNNYFQQFLNGKNINYYIDYDEDFRGDMEVAKIDGSYEVVNIGKLKDQFQEEYKEKLSNLKADEIEREITEFKSLEKRLKAIPKEKYLFYGTNGKDTITNGAKLEDIKKQKVYILIDRDGLESSELVDNMRVYQVFMGVKTDLIDEIGYRENENKIYVALNDNYTMERVAVWTETSEASKFNLKYISIFGGLTLIFFLALSVFAGKNEEGKLEMRSIDKLYTDFNILLCVGIIFGYALSIALLYEKLGYDEFNFENIPLLAITVTLSAFGLTLVMSLMRHIKNGSFIKHSLIYNLFSKIFGSIYRFFREIYDTGSLGKKLIIVLIIYPLAILLTIFIFPITIAFFIWQGLKKVRDFEKIRDGVNKIKEGDLSHKIVLEKEGEFKALAEDINEIGEGLKGAVDNELKSERHRTELITNVSHDIRTPLTSIITYVDLLKHEEDPEKIKEYIKVLDQKSQRLRQLTDDLFEASKLNSGDIPLNIVELDLVSLVTQGLGELHDEIQKSGLEFIYNFPESAYISGDGDLMWRSINNLLSNIFKYGLRGSRVYIDIIEKEDTISLIMKNISAYELNISEEELMERFKRGDESRTSEGSGLGLSIVDSLVKLQGGIFKIDIDGDLFKSTIEMPK